MPPTYLLPPLAYTQPTLQALPKFKLREHRFITSHTDTK